jgi:hypothetical protein
MRNFRPSGPVLAGAGATLALAAAGFIAVLAIASMLTFGARPDGPSAPESDSVNADLDGSGGSSVNAISPPDGAALSSATPHSSAVNVTTGISQSQSTPA